MATQRDVPGAAAGMDAAARGAARGRTTRPSPATPAPRPTPAPCQGCQRERHVPKDTQAAGIHPARSSCHLVLAPENPGCPRRAPLRLAQHGPARHSAPGAPRASASLSPEQAGEHRAPLGSASTKSPLLGGREGVPALPRHQTAPTPPQRHELLLRDSRAEAEDPVLLPVHGMAP